jgi:NAD+ synthase
MQVNGFVIGISGGVDSAVTSTLCAKRTASIMCAHTSSTKSCTRGREHIQQLKIFPVSSIEADLSSVFDTFTTVVPEIEDTAKLHAC